MDEQDKPFDAVDVMNSAALTAGFASAALLAAWVVSLIVPVVS
jgi:hypothetical protein